MPKCPKCNNNEFAISELDLEDSPYELVALACTKCDTIITALEPYANGKNIINMGHSLTDLIALLKDTLRVNALRS